MRAILRREQPACLLGVPAEAELLEPRERLLDQRPVAASLAEGPLRERDSDRSARA